MSFKNNKTFPKRDLFFENRVELEWLSTTEAANFLSLSTNALRIMVCRHQVKSYKLGCRLRFLKSDLLSLLKLKEN